MTPATHEGDRGNDRPVTIAGNQFLATEAILHGHDHCMGEMAVHDARAFFHCIGLGRDNDQVDLAQVGRIGGCDNR
jgi:hypothetical protein